MPTSFVRGLRATKDEWERWSAAASELNQARNNWIRKTLNDHVALTKAQRRANEVKAEAYPQKSGCVHRLMPGTYCKVCGVTK